MEPAYLRDFIRGEVETWGKVVKKAGVGPAG